MSTRGLVGALEPRAAPGGGLGRARLHERPHELAVGDRRARDRDEPRLHRRRADRLGPPAREPDRHPAHARRLHVVRGRARRSRTTPLPYTIGVALDSLPFVFFAWLVLAYPTGRLQTTLDRVLVGLVGVLALVAQPAFYLVDDQSETCAACPDDLLLISRSDTLSSAIEIGSRALAVVVVVAGVAILLRRWLHATPALRRQLAPVLGTAIFAVGVLAGLLVAELFVDELDDAFDWLLLASLLLVPLAFLYGLLQTRLARAEVGRLLLEVPEAAEPEQIEDALRRALGDPTLAARALGRPRAPLRRRPGQGRRARRRHGRAGHDADRVRGAAARRDRARRHPAARAGAARGGGRGRAARAGEGPRPARAPAGRAAPARAARRAPGPHVPRRARRHVPRLQGRLRARPVHRARRGARPHGARPPAGAGWPTS